MPMARFPLFVAVLALAMPTLAAAGPQLIEAADPAGAEVRATAQEFLLRVAEGDAAGAAKGFAGDAEQAALLDAHVKCVAATKRLAAAMVQRIRGAKVPDELLLGEVYKGIAESMPSRIVVLNGDAASVQCGFYLDAGLLLRRTGGAWKVTHVTARPSDAAPLQQGLTR